MKILERQPSEKARSYAIRVLLYNITAHTTKREIGVKLVSKQKKSQFQKK